MVENGKPRKLSPEYCQPTSSRSVSRNEPYSVPVSNNVQPQSRFSIVNLDSGTEYELRVTAYNNAGSTQAEYRFTTLSPNGSNRIHDEHPPETEETSLLFDAHVLAPSVISLLAVFLTVAGVCFCLKTRKFPIDINSINLRRIKGSRHPTLSTDFCTSIAFFTKRR